MWSMMNDMCGINKFIGLCPMVGDIAPSGLVWKRITPGFALLLKDDALPGRKENED